MEWMPLISQDPSIYRVLASNAGVTQPRTRDVSACSAATICQACYKPIKEDLEKRPDPLQQDNGLKFILALGVRRFHRAFGNGSRNDPLMPGRLHGWQYLQQPIMESFSPCATGTWLHLEAPEPVPSFCLATAFIIIPVSLGLAKTQFPHAFFLHLCYPCQKLSSSPLYGLRIIAPHATPLPSSPLNSLHICTAQRLISPFYSSSAEFRLLSCYSALLFRFKHFLTSVAVCHLFCDRSQYRMRQPH